ncbi:phosphatase PAP2 family protein [bacterium]|nr:phosphatase PAP2 family protein [bacterium]
MTIVKSLGAALVAVAVAGAALPEQALADSKSNWDKATTALVFGLAGGAELKTLSLHDNTGQLQFFETMGATLALSEGLKSVVHKKRPDGSGNDSFPSGHAALAFAAASYFDIRYGAENKVLVPVFYGAAALTAIGRVEAKKHYAGDVAAGALIGIAMAHVFTNPHVSVYPTGDGVGVNYTRHF